MSRRRLAVMAVVVVTVLCVVGVAIAAVAAGGQAFAYQVNGTRVSQHSFDAQLDEFANIKKTAIRQQASKTDGSVVSSLTAQVMNLNILRDLVRDAADTRGVELTGADRAAGVAEAKRQLADNYSVMPKKYRELIADFFAYVNALGLTSTTIDAFLGKEVRTADVYVNPRYGTWHPTRGGVCPPSGCVAGG